MKKYIVLIVVLLAVSAGFAFQRKDVLLGGYAELISREHKTKNQIVTDLGLYPQVGVFLDDADLPFSTPAGSTPHAPVPDGR